MYRTHGKDGYCNYKRSAYPIILMRQGGKAHLRLRNLQIPHLDPTRREIRNLKLHINRPLRLPQRTRSTHTTAKPTGHTTAALVVTLDGWKAQLGAHEELLPATELLDFPDYGGLFGGVVHGSDVCAEAGGVCVFGDGDEDFDVVGGAATFELGFGLCLLVVIRLCSKRKGRDLEHVFNSRPGVRFHQTLHPDQRFHLRVQPVAHELKLPIRRNKADRAIVLEPRKTHTLVELDVFHLHRLASRSAPCCLEHDLVVQPQTQLWHSTQIAFHLDRAQDLGSQDVAGCGNEEVQGFDDIEEDLVLAVADSFTSPGDGVGDGDWGAGLDFEFVGFLRDVPVRSAVLSFFPP